MFGWGLSGIMAAISLLHFSYNHCDSFSKPFLGFQTTTFGFLTFVVRPRMTIPISLFVLSRRSCKMGCRRGTNEIPCMSHPKCADGLRYVFIAFCTVTLANYRGIDAVHFYPFSLTHSLTFFGIVHQIPPRLPREQCPQSYHIISYHIISYHIIYHIISYHIISLNII